MRHVHDAVWSIVTFVAMVVSFLVALAATVWLLPQDVIEGAVAGFKAAKYEDPRIFQKVQEDVNLRRQRWAARAQKIGEAVDRKVDYFLQKYLPLE
jgi:hypothetical protein